MIQVDQKCNHVRMMVPGGGLIPGKVELQTMPVYLQHGLPLRGLLGAAIQAVVGGLGVWNIQRLGSEVSVGEGETGTRER